MKKLLWFILALTAAAGCSRQQPADSTLIEVERHLADSPETAIKTLYRLGKEAHTWKTDHDKALYCLLYTEAIHRLGLFTRSDSMIDIAWRYYAKEGTDEEKARVCLCKGVILHDTKRYADAVDYLKRAEEYASGSGDKNLRYRINDRLGLINKEKGCTELALAHYRAALAETAGQESAAYRAAALNHIAETYRAAGMRDSSLAYLRKCLPLINNFKNYTPAEKTTKSDVLTSLAQYYTDRHQWDKAKKTLDRARELLFSTKTSKLYGDYYAAKGESGNAETYWKEALSPQDEETSIEAYKELIALLSAQGRNDEAFSLSRQLNAILYDRQEFSSPAEFISIQNNHDAVVTNQKAYHYTATLFAMIALLTAVILLLVYLSRRKAEARSNEYERGIQQISIPRDNMDRVMCAGLTERLHKLAEQGRQAEPQDWAELTRIMTEQAPQFMDIITRRNALNHRETRITILTRLHFAPSEIAALTRTSAQTVTNSRAQLLTKLFGAKGGAREFDKRIMEV